MLFFFHSAPCLNSYIRTLNEMLNFTVLEAILNTLSAALLTAQPVWAVFNIAVAAAGLQNSVSVKHM